MKAPIQKIALLLPQFIGDSINCIPALEILHSHYPKAEIWVFGNPVVTQLLNRLTYLQVKALSPTNDRKAYIRDLYQGLRSLKPEVCILCNLRFRDALIAYIAGIPIRVGYRAEMRGGLLTHALKINPSRHYMNRYAYLANAILPRPVRCLPKTHLPAKFVNLSKWMLSEKKIHIGLELGRANMESRCYPARFRRDFFELMLDSRQDIGYYHLGIRQEPEFDQQWMLPSFEAHMHNYAGQTNIDELVALLEHMDLIITVDTGVLHLACAINKPVIVLHSQGTTPFSLICPQGKDLTVLESQRLYVDDADQIEDILPSDLHQAVLSSIKKIEAYKEQHPELNLHALYQMAPIGE